MEIIGYFAALLIGLSLGLIGGGGSILTVPVLVYLFSVNPLLATSYSLFIVGLTSLVGAFNNYRKGFINIKVALLFGITSIISVSLTRRLIVHRLPETIRLSGNLSIHSATITMVLFAALMVIAAIFMIRKKNPNNITGERPGNPIKLILLGISIGFVTGFLGAGGGFLLIPALVLMLGLPIKEAIGTSLLIIAMNSLTGFIMDLGHFPIDWKFMLTVSAIAITGILIGGVLARRIEGAKLKKAFGWFVLVMGIYVILKEILFK
jgi:uncharacterized membrane protein YfcA